MAPPTDPRYEPERGWIVGRNRDVRAVLDDPAFVVPAAGPGESGIGWLRGSVSRFANGPDHARRRAHVEAAIATLDRRALRTDAAARTNALLDGAGGDTLDVMSALARAVPLGVLARAVAPTIDAGTFAEAVTAIAPAYPPGSAPEREQTASTAVELLVTELAARDETTVTQLTLLVQACDATAGLIGNTTHIALGLPEPGAGVDALLAETLRYSPPVRNTRRVATADRTIGGAAIVAGDTVVLDFDAANRDPDVFADPDEFRPGRKDRSMTFGHGFRACPGSDHALALAAGVVEPLLTRCRPAAGDVVYEPSPNLRVPAALVVAVD